MKISKIIAASAAAGVILTLCSCSNNGISSSSEDSTSTSQATTQPATKSTITTEDEMFTIEVNERFSRFQGVYPADFECMFVDGETGTTVGILEMSNSHITPEFFFESVRDHYEEQYGTVKGTASEENGMPAYLLEAEFTDTQDDESSEMIFYHKAIQYGNGDLLIPVVTVPKSTPEEAPKAVSDIIAGVTYHGEPLKTETETHDTEYFTVSANKDWFFHSKTDTEAALLPNLAGTLEEHYGSIKITADPSGASAKELAEKDAADFESKEKIINVEVTEDTEWLGHDAICVSSVLCSEYMELKREIYYFDSNGVSFKVQLLAPSECYDKFIPLLDDVYQTIVIK